MCRGDVVCPEKAQAQCVGDDGDRAEAHGGGGDHGVQGDAGEGVENAGGDGDADEVVEEGPEQVLQDGFHDGAA